METGTAMETSAAPILKPADFSQVGHAITSKVIGLKAAVSQTLVRVGKIGIYFV